MKTCNRCLVDKATECFYANGKSGLHPACKECHSEVRRAARAANPEKFRAAESALYYANRDVRKAAMGVYYEKNRLKKLENERQRYQRQADAIKERCAQYRMTHPEKIRFWNGSRRALQKSATPDWADREQIAALYREASQRWAETGIPHHVDHIIPLKGKGVCGLHVIANLQILTQAENLRKGTRITE